MSKVRLGRGTADIGNDRDKALVDQTKSCLNLAFLSDRNTVVIFCLLFLEWTLFDVCWSQLHLLLSVLFIFSPNVHPKDLVNAVNIKFCEVFCFSQSYWFQNWIMSLNIMFTGWARPNAILLCLQLPFRDALRLLHPGDYQKQSATEIKLRKQHKESIGTRLLRTIYDLGFFSCLLLSISPQFEAK